MAEHTSCLLPVWPYIYYTRCLLLPDGFPYAYDMLLCLSSKSVGCLEAAEPLGGRGGSMVLIVIAFVFDRRETYFPRGQSSVPLWPLPLPPLPPPPPSPVAPLSRPLSPLDIKTTGRITPRQQRGRKQKAI